MNERFWMGRTLKHWSYGHEEQWYELNKFARSRGASVLSLDKSDFGRRTTLKIKAKSGREFSYSTIRSDVFEWLKEIQVFIDADIAPHKPRKAARSTIQRRGPGRVKAL